MRRRRILTALCFTALSLLTVSGCTSWATYPPIPGAAGVNDPTLAPIPELMALGIYEAHGPVIEEEIVVDVDGEAAVEVEETDVIVFNLPPETPISTYRSVRRRLAGSRWMETGDDHAYHVHEVRLRLLDAEVDIIHAPEGGAYQMTTFIFKNKAGWKLERRRDWGMRVRVPDRHEPLPAGVRRGATPPEEVVQAPADDA